MKKMEEMPSQLVSILLLKFFSYMMVIFLGIVRKIRLNERREK